MPQPPSSDHIDWKALGGPYGDSGEVPNAIRDLWSDDAETRALAVSFLQENLWHQGTVYEVTAPAVPFVADAALAPHVSRDDRIWLIALLAWIAAGTSGLDAHREFLEQVGQRVDDDEVARELEWVRAGRAAVRERLPEFLARLDDEEDASIQVVLAELAAQFPDDAARSRARLFQLLQTETNATRRIALEVALAALGAEVERDPLLARLPEDYYGEEDVEELRQRFAHEDARAVFRDVLDTIVGAAITFDNA